MSYRGEPRNQGSLVLVKSWRGLEVLQRKSDGLWGPLSSTKGSMHWAYVLGEYDEITEYIPKPLPLADLG